MVGFSCSRTAKSNFEELAQDVCFFFFFITLVCILRVLDPPRRNLYRFFALRKPGAHGRLTVLFAFPFLGRYVLLRSPFPCNPVPHFLCSSPLVNSSGREPAPHPFFLFRVVPRSFIVSPLRFLRTPPSFWNCRPATTLLW